MAEELGVKIGMLFREHHDQVLSLIQASSEESRLAELPPQLVILDSTQPIDVAIHEILKSDNNWSLVALRGDRVVGFTIARPGREEEDEVELVVPALVEQNSRRRGLGGRLLGTALEELEAIGFRSANCLVRYSNQPGIAFLEHHGFNISEDRISDSVCLMAWRNLTQSQAA